MTSNSAPVGFERLASLPFLCVNCHADIDDLKLFCTPLCNDEASWVRYARRCRIDGRDEQPDLAQALRIRLAHILGGGYDRRSRRLSRTVREAVIERAAGKCALCGRPGEEIDHIAGSSGSLSTLQLLCDACHNNKTVASLQTITKDTCPEEWAKLQGLLARARASQPLQLCDARDWNAVQRQLMSHRRTVGDGRMRLF
jgi:hypothetical protein